MGRQSIRLKFETQNASKYDRFSVGQIKSKYIT